MNYNKPFPLTFFGGAGWGVAQDCGRPAQVRDPSAHQRDRGGGWHLAGEQSTTLIVNTYFDSKPGKHDLAYREDEI